MRNGQVIRKRIAELQLELGTQAECNASISAPTRRNETTLDPWLDDPFPDYDTEAAEHALGPTI